MVVQMVRHESLDEIVAVVIARMTSVGQLLTGFAAGLFKQMGMELFFQERVGLPLVNQEMLPRRAFFDKFCRVTVRPAFPV